VPGRIQYCTSKPNSEISGSHNNNFADYYLISNLRETCDGQFRAHSKQFKLFHMTLGMVLGANVWPV